MLSGYYDTCIVQLINDFHPIPKANRKYENDKDASEEPPAKKASSGKGGKGGNKSEAAKKETESKKGTTAAANSRSDLENSFKSIVPSL